MTRWPALPLPAALGLALLVLAGPLQASDREEVDRVRAAVQAGQLLPLTQVLERLQRSHPGQVLEVELERDDGRWIYDVKLLQAGGRLLKLELDGRTAAVIKQRVKRAAPAASR
jgi:uncharacterized membrane protein YkoI